MDVDLIVMGAQGSSGIELMLYGSNIAGIGIQVTAAWLPFSANLLGNAGIPLELWALVFGGAFLAWSLAETFSRLAWRHQTHQGIGR